MKFLNNLTTGRCCVHSVSKQVTFSVGTSALNEYKKHIDRLFAQSENDFGAEILKLELNNVWDDTHTQLSAFLGVPTFIIT